MAFDVVADAYDRFMGRYSRPLAAKLVRAAHVTPGQSVLDVGCGPGALTSQLVDLLGAEAVTAIEPSASFVQALRERLPAVDIRQGSAESLPYADDTFDAAIAQLVVPFMADPVAGLREMARVTSPGGLVAACAWDQEGGRSPLRTYWEAAGDVVPGSGLEVMLAGARDGHLAALFDEAGLRDLEQSELTINVRVATFDEWWTPMTEGVGPVGDHYLRLDPSQRDKLRARCAELLPAGPIDVTGTAWCVVGQPAS